MIKNFSIFKAKEKKNDNSPDYNISVKVNDKFINAGGCWLKEGKDGQKYFSCRLSEGYKDIRGLTIVLDEPKAVGSDIPESQIPF